MYNLVRGDIELQAELERPQPFKCGSFGASSLAERHLATGDFGGNLATWDLERLNTPVYAAKAHDTIINCLDGCGGVKGAGAPEIATGSRDGRVHVWDVRQPEVPVASMEPEAGGAPRYRREIGRHPIRIGSFSRAAPVRDCWSVAFGDAHSSSSRVVAAG